MTTSARKMPLLMRSQILKIASWVADVEVALLVEAQAVPGPHDLLDLAHGRVTRHVLARDDDDRDVAVDDAEDAQRVGAVDLLPGRVRDDRELVGLAAAERVRPLAEDADDRVRACGRCGSACRSGSVAGNSALPGALPRTTTLRRRSTSAWVKTRPDSSGIELVSPKLALAPITRHPLGGVVAVGEALGARARAAAQLHRHRLHQRRALDRLRVLDGDVRPLDEVAELLALREADEAELGARTSCCGPICRNRSLNDSSKPRISAVMLTIEVMPMTTPRIVSAERILLVRRVSTAIVRISWRRPARSPDDAMSVVPHSRRRASIGSRLAARMAG